MKKLVVLASLIMMALLSSCTDNKEVETAAKGFLEHSSRGEFNEAKKYADEGLSTMLGMAAGMYDAATIEKIKQQDVKIEILSSEIKDDHATVKFKTSLKDGKDTAKEDEIELVKIGEDWKVTLGDKNPFGGGGSNTAPAK